uniref:Uncharacterized protein n=1 Tax=Tetranychus urticae TaxID=32264 RepID=T1KM33_TETUR
MKMVQLRFGIAANIPANIANKKCLSQDFYYIYDKANVTLKILPEKSKFYCGDNGICTSPLSVLQKAEIDLNYFFPLNGLNTIGENLTSGPGAMEDNCYLSYSKRKLQSSIYNLTFSDFIFTFDPTFWFALLGLKLLFLLFATAFLMVSKILSNSLKTGLIQNMDYLNLEIFQDVIDNNFTTSTIDFTMCSHEFLNSKDALVGRVREKSTICSFRDKSVHDIYAYRTREMVATVENEQGFEITKSYGCLYDQEMALNEPYSKSESQVLHIVYGFLINKFNSVSVNRIIVNGLYSASEFGITISKKLLQIETKCYLGATASPSCIDDGFDQQEMLPSPISLNYLFVPFIQLGIGLLLACMFFVFSLFGVLDID